MSRYVIVDLEMCTVPKGDKRKNYKCKNEIIQIGAVAVNEELEIVDSFSTFVKPEFGEITPYIENLTGIKKSDTEGAPLVSDALNAFTEWMPDDAIPVSWSENDEIQLRRECGAKHIETSKLDGFFDSWTDCQAIFGDKMENRKCYNLTEALTIAGIVYDEGIHNALVDAKNTAELFIKMKKEPKLKLSSYYMTASDVGSFGFTPFADLFAKHGLLV